jgi:hypothetical protein
VDTGFGWDDGPSRYFGCIRVARDDPVLRRNALAEACGMNITKPCARPSAASWRAASLSACLLCIAALSGCMSPAPEAVGPTEPPQGAINTGTYPNLNIPPQSAAQPISDDDKTQINARIGAAQGRQSASGRGAGTQGDPAVLKRLAESHGQDALDAIAER